MRPQYKEEPESSEAFKARIQEHIDRYEAQFLPRSKRKLTTKRIREMDAGTADGPPVPIFLQLPLACLSKPC